MWGGYAILDVVWSVAEGNHLDGKSVWSIRVFSLQREGLPFRRMCREIGPVPAFRLASDPLMEGPTPVSALSSHCYDVFGGDYFTYFGEDLLPAHGRCAHGSHSLSGPTTMVTGAIKALKGWDIKKGVLAYSTMSQLGLMVMAVRFGSWQTAFFSPRHPRFFKQGYSFQLAR